MEHIGITRLFLKKKIYIGSGSPGVGPNQTQNQNQFDSDFNSIHFGIEINKYLKFLTPKNVWVEKFFTFLKILKISLYFSNIF
jgi:hypothetical protein